MTAASAVQKRYVVNGCFALSKFMRYTTAMQKAAFLKQLLSFEGHFH